MYNLNRIKNLGLGIFFLLFLPFQSLGIRGWNCKNYSMLYGPTYTANYKTYHSIDLQFESLLSTCTNRVNIKGLALSSSFAHNFQEFGVRGFINTRRISSIAISRKIRVFSYFYIQGNAVRENGELRQENLNVRPGIGLTSTFGFGNVLIGKLQIQGGYNCNKYYFKQNSGFVLELKIGFGIDRNKLRIKKSNTVKLILLNSCSKL